MFLMGTNYTRVAVTASGMYDTNIMKKLKLSVIMPVYNEEDTITEILKRLLGIAEVSEVVIVDDGSSDGTVKLIKKNSDKRIKLFQKANGGKGSAIREGLKHVTGEYVLIQDADLEYDPTDIPMLVRPIQTGKAEIVFGSRFLGPHLNLLFWHWVGNHALNLLVNILYNTTLSDMETCYKVMPTQYLRDLDLKSNQFDIEPEITCKLLNAGHRIFEVPISYTGRDFSEGKKITWRDGVVALKVIIATRFLS